MESGKQTGGTEDWQAYGACRNDPDAMFVTGEAQQEAKKTCWGCSVRPECLADALDSRTAHGVWGGMTERERRRKLNKNPDVKDWNAEIMQYVPPLGDRIAGQSRIPFKKRALKIIGTTALETEADTVVDTAPPAEAA